jgi:hypothetical protein
MEAGRKAARGRARAGPSCGGQRGRDQQNRERNTALTVQRATNRPDTSQQPFATQKVEITVDNRYFQVTRPCPGGYYSHFRTPSTYIYFRTIIIIIIIRYSIWEMLIP